MSQTITVLCRGRGLGTLLVLVSNGMPLLSTLPRSGEPPVLSIFACLDRSEIGWLSVYGIKIHDDTNL